MRAMTAGTHAVEYCCHWLQVAKVDVEGSKRRDDHEVRQDEGPAACPGAPKTGAQVGDVNADLDRERPRQRLAYRDRLAHLLLGEPSALVRQFAAHLTHQRDRTAKAKQAKAEKVANDFRDPIARSIEGFCHPERAAMRAQFRATLTVLSAASRPLASLTASSLAQK